MKSEWGSWGEAAQKMPAPAAGAPKVEDPLAALFARCFHARDGVRLLITESEFEAARARLAALEEVARAAQSMLAAGGSGLHRIRPLEDALDRLKETK